METVILVVAHPDDVAYGMGGTAILLKDKYHLHVVCATRGERGKKGTSMAETAALREKEEIAACKQLGAELTFLNLIDREVFADKVNSQKLARILKKIQPVAVFTIWPMDSHPDHSAISEMTKKALFLSGVETQLHFCEESVGDQATHFSPDIYVDISGVIEEKRELIRHYVTQNREDGLVGIAENQFRFRGRECGCHYAEGFKTVFPVTSTCKSILLKL